MVGQVGEGEGWWKKIRAEKRGDRGGQAGRRY